jgi:hypothetical protein
LHFAKQKENFLFAGKGAFMQVKLWHELLVGFLVF